MKQDVILLTLYGMYNYGNRLQNYAAVKLITKKGKTCKNLVIRKGKLFQRLKYIVRHAKRYVPDQRQVYHERLFNFEKFHNRYIKDIWVSKDEIKKLQEEYSTFVVGSDQVWNPHFSGWDEEGTFFLSFAKDAKKLSLAASFGVDDLENEQSKMVAKWLEDFECISVREEAGKEIVEKYTNKMAEVLLDPTMAITGDEWREVKMTSRNAKKICNSKKYILTYFLGDKNENVMENIRKIASENSLDIICLNDESYSKYYEFGPAEFVHLIDNAKLVCTDSFHGAAFSINLKTPFIVFERKDSLKDMSSRLKTLLNKFKLEQRRWENISKENYFSPYDKEVDEILRHEREKMDKFLSDALK